MGNWHHNVVRLSVTLYIVAKQYNQQQKCLDMWEESALLRTDSTISNLYY